MFKISRMKSVLTLSPALSNSTAALLFPSICTPIPPLFFAKQPTLDPSISKTLMFFSQHYHTNNQFLIKIEAFGVSGEILVIVGPLLAGKTTTLLQRMKLASRNGRRSFGSALDIIPIADTVTKLSARCEVCGENAVFTLRKTDETRTEVIAGAEVYMPVCRIHYISGQMVKKLSHFS